MVSNKNQSNYCNTTAGKLDWGDYPVITLKRYLYGMALTSKLETVHLIHLDNDVCKIVRVPQPFFHFTSLADVQGALLNARPYQQAGADRKRRNRA